MPQAISLTGSLFLGVLLGCQGNSKSGDTGRAWLEIETSSQSVRVGENIEIVEIIRNDGAHGKGVNFNMVSRVLERIADSHGTPVADGLDIASRYADWQQGSLHVAGWNWSWRHTGHGASERERSIPYRMKINCAGEYEYIVKWYYVSEKPPRSLGEAESRVRLVVED